MSKYLLVLIMLLPTWGFAKSSNSTGLLKQVDYAELEAIIHKKLIADVKVVNHVYKVVDGMHTHPAIRGCSKTVKHNHKARKGHYHRYSCRAVRRYMPRAKAAGVAKASSTNLQEQGVDEADLVKTDGRYLYAVESNAGIRIYDTQHRGKQLKQIAVIGFKNNHIKGIYLLAGQKKLLVIASSHSGRWSPSYTNQTHIITVDIRNPSKPKTIKQIIVDGDVDSTRRIDNMLYLVSKKRFNLPSTYERIETTKPLSEVVIQQKRQQIIAKIKKWRMKDQLPMYRQQGKAGVHTLLKEGEIYYNPASLDTYGFTTILTVNLASKNTNIKSIGWLGKDYGIDYFSQKALYITSTDYRHLAKNSRYPRNAEKTLIHKFAYRNSGFDYRGSGYALGNFGGSWRRNSSFRLDEDQKGTLRVVSNNSRAAYFTKRKSSDPALKSPVVLTTLTEHPQKKELMILDNLPNKRYPKALGKPEEQLYGARLFDDYAYFVTFRRTDPLYVVDLRQPHHLKLTGELVIPGFSDYLHPLGNGLLLGVGKGGKPQKNGREQTNAVKLSLFDVRNPRAPKEVHKILVGSDGWAFTEATENHHAFTSLSMDNRTTRVAIPITANEKALYRFEIDKVQRKIKNLGAMKSLNGKWSWSWNDRSIMIGDRLYYYHNGKFTAGNWKG